MNFKKGKRVEWNLTRIILTLIFFLFFFLYIRFIVNPVLIFQQQNPVFFLDTKFLYEYMSYPGGIIEYISAFLSQFTYYPLIGAFIFTFIAVVVSLLTKAMYRAFNNGQQPIFIQFVPVVLWLPIFGNYYAPLALSIGPLFSLLFFILYSKLLHQSWAIRFCIYIILTSILYYVSAGPFILFVLLCAFVEFIVKKKYILSVIYLPMVVILPYLAAKLFFLVSLKSAYTHLLPFRDDYYFGIFPIILYLIFPVIAWMNFVRYQFKWDHITKRPMVINRYTKQLGKKKNLLKLTMLIIFTILLIVIYNNPMEKNYQLVNYYARFGKWQEILNLVDRNMSNSKIIAFQTCRALYHTGQLPNRLFQYRFDDNPDFLLFSNDLSPLWPSLKSDLLFDLGHLNESQHWIFESVSGWGYTSYDLQKLALINLAKDEIEVARMCLNLLIKTILFKDWAEYYLQIIDSRIMLSNDAELYKIRNRMVRNEFIINYVNPELDLVAILDGGQPNKMAFDYLMAYYLITHQLDRFFYYYKRIYDYYDNIPIHYSEALLLYLFLYSQENLDLSGYRVSAETNRNFQGFLAVIDRHEGDLAAARLEIINQFDGSYWVYFLYNFPITQR